MQLEYYVIVHNSHFLIRIKITVRNQIDKFLKEHYYQNGSLQSYKYKLTTRG